MQRGFLFPFAALTAALALLGASCQTQSTAQPTPETQPETTASADAQPLEQPQTGSLEDGSYQIAAAESTLNWKASKVTGQHFGTINVTSGSFTVENGMPTSGTFTINMDSITILDLEPGEMHDRLSAHLRSDDFFSVETYPHSTFEIASAEPAGGNDYVLSGVLTIKGIAKPISFPVTISEDGGRLRASGTATVDRTDYDIRFRSGKFFEDLGDSLIHDEFTLELDLVAQTS